MNESQPAPKEAPERVSLLFRSGLSPVLAYAHSNYDEPKDSVLTLFADRELAERATTSLPSDQKQAFTSGIPALKYGIEETKGLTLRGKEALYFSAFLKLLYKVDDIDVKKGKQIGAFANKENQEGPAYAFIVWRAPDNTLHASFLYSREQVRLLLHPLSWLPTSARKDFAREIESVLPLTTKQAAVHATGPIADTLFRALLVGEAAMSRSRNKS